MTSAETLLPDIGAGLANRQVKKHRSLSKKLTYPPRLGFNLLLLCLISLSVLTMLGFQPIPLPSANPVDLLTAGAGTMPEIQYTFQLVGLVMLASVLGPLMGSALGVLFVGLGLFVLPVFANGGGVAYITQPGFGYILGAAFSAVLISLKFHTLFKENREGKRISSLPASIFKLSLLAVLVIHGTGLLYLVILSVLHQLSWGDLRGWFIRFTIDMLPYDIVFMFLALGTVRWIRMAFWLILY